MASLLSALKLPSSASDADVALTRMMMAGAAGRGEDSTPRVSFQDYLQHHQRLLEAAAAFASSTEGGGTGDALPSSPSESPSKVGSWSVPLLARAAVLSGTPRPVSGLTSLATLAALRGPSFLLSPDPSASASAATHPGSEVRLFLSSTFTDTQCERTALHQRVFPVGRKLCEALGLRFMPVDMRWGIREASTNDHSTSDICMAEIERAWLGSGGGKRMWFVGLLGDKVRVGGPAEELSLVDHSFLPSDAMYAAVVFPKRSPSLLSFPLIFFDTVSTATARSPHPSLRPSLRSSALPPRELKTRRGFTPWTNGSVPTGTASPPSTP